MTYLLRFTAIMLAVGLAPAIATAIPWPVHPDSTVHRIGNSYGEYQYYGGAPYLHPGIDILVPAGTPVYAVKSGYVKAVLTTSLRLEKRSACLY